jgi:serine beta-lactamase-like protein LACTB, mitochondrial
MRCRPERGSSQRHQRLALFLSVVALGACASAPPANVSSVGAQSIASVAEGASCTDSSSAFRQIVEAFQARQQNAGIVVGVQHRGLTVFRQASGFADLETRTTVDAAMAFSIASISKAFTGVLLLQLAEAGRLDLDADVQQYVAEFPRHPSGRPITLRMLAYHLGAVRHWGPERDDRVYNRRFDDVAEILSLFLYDPWVPDLEPRTRYAYSSYGYNLLGIAMQRATGTSFQLLLRDLVLRPLSLNTVLVDRPGLGGARRPARYSWYDLTDFHDLEQAPQRVPDWDYSHNMAGGGLIATVDDLLVFGRAMREPGLLNTESLAQLWEKPLIDGVESRMSFGWSPRELPARLVASGSNAGVQAALAVWKDPDVVVAVLANSWGRGARSGELMDDGADGLIGRLAAVCGVRAPR